MISLVLLGRFSSTSCLYGRAGRSRASPFVVRAASGTSNPFVHRRMGRKKVPKPKIGDIARNKSLPCVLYCVIGNTLIKIYLHHLLFLRPYRVYDL